MRFDLDDIITVGAGALGVAIVIGEISILFLGCLALTKYIFGVF